MEIEKNSF